MDQKIGIKDSVVFKVFITLSFIFLSSGIIIEYYCNKGIIPFVLYYIVQGMSLFTVFLLAIFIRPKMTIYRYVFLACIGLIFVMSIPDTRLNLSGSVYITSIYIGMVGAFFFSVYDIKVWHNFFICLSVVSILSLIYVYFGIGVDVEDALRRKYSWDELFFYIALYWAVIPFVISSLLKGKHILLSVLYWAGSIVLNLLVLKRYIIFDSVVLLAVIILILLIHKNKKKVLLYTFISLLAVSGAAIYFFGDELLILLNKVIERILKTGEDLSTFDRWIETKNYLAVKSYKNILLGEGVLGFHEGLGFVRYALHSGWSNFLLKGGVLLLSLVVAGYAYLLSLTSKIKHAPVTVQFSYWVLIVYVVKLLYSNMHSFAPEMLLFFYCLFNITDYAVAQKKFSIMRLTGIVLCISVVMVSGFYLKSDLEKDYTEIPTTPQNFIVSDVTATTVSLTWDASKDNIRVVGYQIYRDEKRIATTPLTVYTGKGLVPGQSYTYYIRAYDNSGNFSEFTDSVVVITVEDFEPPTAPSKLKATEVTHTTVTLVWEASKDNVGIKTYEIYRNDKKLTTTGKTEYISKSLIPGREYEYYIIAYDAAGNVSESSKTIAVTTVEDIEQPSTPWYIRVTEETETSVTLAWNVSTDNAGIKGYEVYCNGKRITTTDKPQYTHKDPIPGQTYEYMIKAVDVAGNKSDYSSVFSRVHS